MVEYNSKDSDLIPTMPFRSGAVSDLDKSTYSASSIPVRQRQDDGNYQVSYLSTNILNIHLDAANELII